MVSGEPKAKNGKYRLQITPKPVQEDPITVIACGILRNEIESIQKSTGKTLKVNYLSPAPCIDQANMKRQLELLLSKAKDRGERLLVVIGRCHPDIDEILANYGAQRVKINDCFDALLGEERKELSAESNTFFTTASWLDHWKRFSQQMAWDDVDARQNLGGNDRVLLLDTGIEPLTDEKILEFFDTIQVPIEIKSVDLSHFATFLKNELASLGTKKPS